MSDQKPYTPDLAYVRESYIHGAAEWEHESIKAADFDRFIAQVRRDAAREALDGLAAEVRLEWHERHHWVLQPIDGYRNDSYPEETP